MGRYVSEAEEKKTTLTVAEGGTGQTTPDAALASLGGVSAIDLANALTNVVSISNPVFNSISNYTALDKGLLSTGTIVFDKTDSCFQKILVGGPITLEVTGFDSGKYSDLLIEIINGGLFAVTMPVVRWILPTTGGFTNSFNTYLLATGRYPTTLQTNGSDFILIWSDGDGILYGKIV